MNQIAQSRCLPAGYVFRAKLILMLSDGSSFRTIKQRLQTTAPTIIRWKQWFREQGLHGLDTFHPGQKLTVLTPAIRARILAATRKKPSDGSTHWSCRKFLFRAKPFTVPGGRTMEPVPEMAAFATRLGFRFVAYEIGDTNHSAAAGG